VITGMPAKLNRISSECAHQGYLLVGVHAKASWVGSDRVRTHKI